MQARDRLRIAENVLSAAILMRNDVHGLNFHAFEGACSIV